VNLYRHVANDPINGTDPLGLLKFKIGGWTFYVHPNDPDPSPSKPHAHLDTPYSGRKVHIETGEVYHRGKPTGRFIPRKVLEELQTQMRRKGLLGIAIFVILATPDVVHAGQEAGVGGASQAVGDVLVDAVVGTGVSAGVGITVTSVTTVTMGGSAVTGFAGATGVGGAIVGTAALGYEVGNAIGQITIGDQTIHDHIADAIIWGLDKLGLW